MFFVAVSSGVIIAGAETFDYKFNSLPLPKAYYQFGQRCCRIRRFFACF